MGSTINRLQNSCTLADLFGRPIQLNLASSTVFRTALGGLFSIAFLAVTILIFWSSVRKKFLFKFKDWL